MAIQRNNRNSGYYGQKKASTAMKVSDMLTFDSAGFIVPGGSGKVVGLALETIQSSDKDFASTRDVVYSGFKHDDEFIIPVITIATAGAFVVGQTYKILTVGTTNFTSIGASANTVGVSFVATGAGTGTGTASTAGGALQTHVGELVDISSVDASAADVGASTNKQIQVVKVLSPSAIVGRFVVQTV